ncbi:MAG TPA: hypothetical protein P5026_12940, partial [Kiritimatiellia bacterium]|nr:hypothetical protein [Kiritimatiellia bacterium]HRU71661.1 hypothetical protein [Kiritimatiellia bacterium]
PRRKPSGAALRGVLQEPLQFISVNTGLLDRCIGLNTIEVFTAANVIGNSVLAGLSGLFSGGVQLKSVNVKDVIGCYDVLRHPRTMDEDNTDTVLGKERR